MQEIPLQILFALIEIPFYKSSQAIAYFLLWLSTYKSVSTDEIPPEEKGPISHILASATSRPIYKGTCQLFRETSVFLLTSCGGGGVWIEKIASRL